MICERCGESNCKINHFMMDAMIDPPMPAKSSPGEPSLAYLERLVLEVRERLERLEKRMEKARAPE